MAQATHSLYRAFWLGRSLAGPTPETLSAMELAKAEAERLAEILATEFGVRRVYLFGSFAWGPEARPDSDLDLAVEGLHRGKRVLAHTRLSESSEYLVDLVSLNRIQGVLRERILTSGIVVYDRQPEYAAG